MGFLEDFYAAAQQSVSHRDSIGEGKAGRGRCEAPLHRDVILRAGKRMQTRGGGCIAVANAFTRSGLRQIQQSDSHLHSCGVSDFLRLLLLQPLREKKKKKIILKTSCSREEWGKVAANHMTGMKSIPTTPPPPQTWWMSCCCCWALCSYMPDCPLKKKGEKKVLRNIHLHGVPTVILR